MKFYKFTNLNEIHYGVQYNDGLCVDPEPFEKSTLCGGGLFIFNQFQLVEYLDYVKQGDGYWIREVVIPSNASFVQLKTKSKSDRLFLHFRKKFELDELKNYIFDEGWEAKLIDGLHDESVSFCTINALYEFATSECSASIVKSLFSIIRSKNRQFDPLRGFENACKTGNVDVVEYLVQHEGMDDWDKGLMIGCEEGKIEIVKFMVHAGATFFNWALNMACKCGHIDIARYLCENKNTTDFNGGLSKACGEGLGELVLLMIECGASECKGCSTIQEHVNQYSYT